MGTEGLCPDIMFHLKILPAIGMAFVVAGCTSGTRMEVGHSGNAPDPASIAVSADAGLPTQFEAAVVDSLKTQGFTLSEHPSYRLELSVSQLRGKAGLFAPDEQGRASSVWIMSPARSRSATTVRATMRLIDVVNGRELFRAYANERSNKAPLDVGKRLADALINQLQMPQLQPSSPDHGPERSEEAG